MYIYIYICPHMHMSVHTQIYTHNRNILPHLRIILRLLWPLGVWEWRTHKRVATVTNWKEAGQHWRKSPTPINTLNFVMGYECSSINWAVLLACHGRLKWWAHLSCHRYRLLMLSFSAAQTLKVLCSVLWSKQNKTKKTHTYTFFSCSFPVPNLREDGKLHPRIH